jgi:hypothetical protein
MATGMALLFIGVPTAYAYYDQANYTEAYFILPNESAFFIPDVGANKETQGGFGSEAYLQENKIPAKRFEIPHQKLSGTSFIEGIFADLITDKRLDLTATNAIHDNYSAQKIAPVLDILKTKALLDVAHKWNGQLPSLPSVVVLPSNLTDILTGLAKAPDGEKK